MDPHFGTQLAGDDFWKKLSPLRNSRTKSKVLDDIDSQLDTDIYRNESDLVNWGHEACHGIASRIRMIRGQYTIGYYPTSNLAFQRRQRKQIAATLYQMAVNKVRKIAFGAINGFYIMNGYYCTVNEPSNIKLSTIANLIPRDLRKVSYQLYLVEQQRYWNNESCYIIDEAVAYQNGTVVGIDINEIPRAEDSFHRALEMNVYAKYLAKQAGQPDIDKIVDFVTNRNMKIYERLPKNNPQVEANYNDLMELSL